MPSTASMPTCSAPGSTGSRSNSASTAKTPRTHKAGQALGHTRSHNSATRASRIRQASRRVCLRNCRAAVRSVMQHLAYAAPRPDRPASPG